MARRSWILALILGLALAVGAGLAWRAGVFEPQSAGAPQPSAIGGPFQLVDTAGRPVDERLLQGKWTAIFFGFTYCPDVCPLTLQTLIEARERLGPKGKDLQIVFVSVDPERDTPEQVATYLQNFPGVIGLTGSPDQVAGAAKAYRVWYAKRGEGPDYLVDHTSAAYLMDPQGRFVNPITHGLGPEQAADVIARAMAGR